MTTELTAEAWAQIRHDYEHTDRPVEEICAEHGISSGTLRNRMRRWSWTRRRAPIPFEGPPPAPPIDIASLAGAAPIPVVPELLPAAPSLTTAAQIETATPPLAVALQAASGGDAGTSAEADAGAIARSLQSAVARVLPAIEATVARLAAGSQHPREMERAARALAALTRTMRELNSLLSQRQAAAATGPPYDDIPEDIDGIRRELARRIHAFVESRTGQADGVAAAGETPATAPRLG